MNTIAYTTEEVTVTKQVPVLDENNEQKKDDDGNPIYTEEEVTTNTLRIAIDHISASQMGGVLYFNAEQMAQMNELLDVKYAALWSQLLKGVAVQANL